MSIKLQLTETADIDGSGFHFYVAEGDVFDADDYAEAYGLNRSDIDERGIHQAQDMSAQLVTGQWLRVEHEEVCDYCGSGAGDAGCAECREEGRA